MAVGLSETQAIAYIERLGIGFDSLGIVVACINSPTSVTISGNEMHINSLEQLLVKDSIFARKLKVNQRWVSLAEADFYQDLAPFLYANIRQLAHAEADWIDKIVDKEYLQRLSNRFEQFSSEVRFYVEVARYLLPIYVES
ncbi:polyketide synthase [Penicillium angulare]|uniref:polyketide synthase n=1 Tax=Penicillium angulare TaxID=116970 RepID=UPI002540C21F|nr:polyketide synthase [Penicillium angulare]KAJ5273330.1 polyketide synthase [Penicillium angulare]